VKDFLLRKKSNSPNKKTYIFSKTIYFTTFHGYPYTLVVILLVYQGSDYFILSYKLRIAPSFYYFTGTLRTRGKTDEKEQDFLKLWQSHTIFFAPFFE